MLDLKTRKSENKYIKEIYKEIRNGNTLILESCNNKGIAIINKLLKDNCFNNSNEKLLIISDTNNKKYYTKLIEQLRVDRKIDNLVLKGVVCRYGKENEIYNSLQATIKESIKLGIKKIYIEYIFGVIFLMNIDQFKEYFSQAKFIVSAQLDLELDIMKNQLFKEVFDNVLIGKLMSNEKDQLNNVGIQIDKKNRVSSYYLYNIETQSLSYLL